MITSLREFREHQETKRQKARKDAQQRARRTAILQILYKHLPRTEDNKQRTDTVINIAADIEQYLDETEEATATA